MGKANVAVNRWLSDKERFADLFNGFLFHGKQIIQPEELENLDREADILITDKSGKARGVQRYRDIIKRWKKDMELVVLACESQKKVHYAMPVRNMLYDSLAYTDQIQEVWRQQKKENRITSEEFLSRFRLKDKIYPVITLVIYYDVKKWDGAVDLYGMFPAVSDEKMQKVLNEFVPNYRINLVDAGCVEQVERFHTDLQQVFGMLKCRNSKEELQQYIYRNQEYFSSVDVETYQALGEFLHMEKELEKMADVRKGEKVDMCQALKEWYADGVEEGRNDGRAEILRELIGKKRKKGLSVEEIADILEVDAETIRALMEERN